MFKLSVSSPHMNITISKNGTERCESQSNCFLIAPQSSLSILPIVQEALKITIQNWKVAGSIFLPVFLLYSLLEFVTNYLILGPNLHDLWSKLELVVADLQAPINGVTDITRRDIRRVLVPELIKWLISCAIWVLFVVTTISISSEAHTDKKLTMTKKDLISKIGKTWKKPLITCFCTTLITISLIILFLFSLGLVSVLAEGVILFVLIVTWTILGVFCCFYVAAISILSLVVSVLEDDASFGLKAIDRAMELMKGKRLKGCALQLAIVLTSIIIHIASFFIERKIQMPLIVMFPKVFLTCMIQLFMFMAYTVFYHECKKYHEQGGETGLYTPISSDDEA